MLTKKKHHFRDKLIFPITLFLHFIKRFYQVPSFPVYTRSGEVTVTLKYLGKKTMDGEQLEKLIDFHHFVFTSVLHLEKDPMVFSPESADIGLLIVPLNFDQGLLTSLFA